MISGLHHYALQVPDLAVAEGFLQDFGLETGEKDGSLIATCPGRDQEQVRLLPGPAKRLHHVSFTVQPGSMDSVREALERSGTPVIEPPAGAATDGDLPRQPRTHQLKPSQRKAAPTKECTMSRDLAAIFADIDSFDPDKFAARLTPDVTFRFGNADPVTGRAAVREAVAGFFSTIDGLTHHILNVYESGETSIAKIDVEYLRKDGKSVTVPNADILVFDGDLVSDWQIYIDVAPVYA